MISRCDTVTAVAPPVDPAPLTLPQARALLGSASRELLWGLRAVRREHRSWMRRAVAIPDPRLRRQAVTALQDKRPLLDGAALFWTIPPRRDPHLLRLLVAFQILANYHDRAGEHAALTGEEAGPGCSMATFAEVIDLARTPAGYRPTADHRDGGYLAALVTACRDGCARLPGYPAARPHLVEAARRCGSLSTR